MLCTPIHQFHGQNLVLGFRLLAAKLSGQQFSDSLAHFRLRYG